MIERHHYFRLKEPWANPAGQAELIERALAVLPTLPGVLGMVAGTPADAAAAASWDVVITLRFASLADVDVYRADPAHRRFVEELIAPRVEVKKVWNFAVQDRRRDD